MLSRVTSTPCAVGTEIITDVGFVVKAFTQEMRALGPTTVSEHDSETEDSWTDVNEGKM